MCTRQSPFRILSPSVERPVRSHAMDTRRTHLICAAGLAAIVIVVTGGAQSAQSPARLPARLDSYIKSYVKLTPEEQKRLLAGEPVTQLLESDPAKEVA